MRVFWICILVSLCMTCCQYFKDGALEEKLVQFSDETMVVADADKIKVRIKYFNVEGSLMDSTERFVNRDYFEWYPWLSGRFASLRKGERYQWTLVEDWPDPEVPLEWNVALLDVEVLETWKLKEWLGALSQMAQSGLFPEDSVIQWLGANWIGDQPWEGKRTGLLWRWVRKMEGSTLDTNQQIVTHISTRSLDGELLYSRVDIVAYLNSQQQWIPAIQWVIPHLHDGDSVEIVSKSEWTFEQLDQLGIPRHTPLKFNVGVHTVKNPY